MFPSLSIKMRSVCVRVCVCVCVCVRERSMRLHSFSLILSLISITEERNKRGWEGEKKKGRQLAQRQRKWKGGRIKALERRGREEGGGGGGGGRNSERGRGKKKTILPDLHLNHSRSCHGDADSSSSRCLTFLRPLPSNQGRTRVEEKGVRPEFPPEVER